jgi:hypothetical protein
VKTFRISELPEGVVFEWTRENRAAPRGEWGMPLTLRTSRRDPAGSAEPVEHVLGWHYEDQTLEGVWDDRYLGAGGALNTLRDFEDLVKRAAPVRIEFEQQTFEGLIKHFTPTYKRKSLISYSFTVSPHRRPSVSSEVFQPVVPNDDPSTSVTAIQVESEELAVKRAKIAQQVPFQPKTDFLDVIQENINQLAAEMDAAKQMLEERLEQPEAILRLAARFAAAGSAARAVVATSTSADSGVDIAVQNAIAVLTYDEFSRSTMTAARLIHRAAMDAQKETARRARPTGVQIYRPYKGESVYGVSQRFYGTPHEWRRIMEINLLKSPEFTGSEKLTIPALP